MAGTFAVDGWCSAVQVIQSYAYVGTANKGITVLDIHDPTSPTEVAHLQTGGVYWMEVEDTILYVAEGWGYHVAIRTFDVSNPEAPVKVFVPPGTGLDHPPKKGEYVVRHSYGWARFAVSNQHIYVAGLVEGGSHSGKPALFVVDATDPSDLQEVARLTFVHSPVAVAVDGDYAYVLCGHLYTSIYVIDIQDPRNPSIVSTIYRPKYDPETIVAQDGFVYSGGNNDILVYDVQDPLSPQYIGPINGYISLYNLATSNNLLVGVWADVIKVFDVTDPRDRPQLGSYSLEEGRGGAMIGDLVWRCSGTRGCCYPAIGAE